MAFSVRTRVLFYFVSIVLMGCGAPPNTSEIIGEKQEPPVPVLSTVSFLVDSVTTTLNSPIASALSLQPDLITGICSVFTNEAEITFSGTYDATQVTQMRITGPLLDDISLSAGTFTIKACLSRGSTAVSIVGLTTDGTASNPIELSITVQAPLKTLAFGHPRYPSPGFRLESGSASVSSLSGGTLTARQFSVGESAQTVAATTGNPAYSLAVGFTQVVKEVSP